MRWRAAIGPRERPPMRTMMMTTMIPPPTMSFASFSLSFSLFLGFSLSGLRLLLFFDQFFLLVFREREKERLACGERG